MKMDQSRELLANEVDVALAQSARPFAIHNARKVDARGGAEHYWLVSDGDAIVAFGDRDADFAAACASVG
ncbi:N-acetylglucosamine-6-phosphate deacetylase, partial [Bifidobacterium pseudocatenulatum]|nr:N-acetylglucosamine-6-phosphate deacetylase [Bifidobacterium pseudocatenulatum]